MEADSFVKKYRSFTTFRADRCGKVTLFEAEIQPGEVIWIPFGKTHRLENSGDTPMVLLVGIVPGHTD